MPNKKLTKEIQENLDYIYEVQKDLTSFIHTQALLEWDQLVNMPKDGVVSRAACSRLGAKNIHELSASNKVWKALKFLKNAEIFSQLKRKDQNVVKRFYKDVERSRKLSKELAMEMSEAGTHGYQKWEEAKKKGDFSIFKKDLKKIFELKKKAAVFIDKKQDPYQVLIHDYEEGADLDETYKEFENLKVQLSDLLKRIRDSKIYKSQGKIKKKFEKRFDTDIQMKISRILGDKILMAKDKTRLDLSEHPFSVTVGHDDVRQTTTLREDDLLYSITSTMHESGHGLFEMNLPKTYWNTVVTYTPGFAVHESQSRIFENNVGRSRAFVKNLFPILKKEYGKIFSGITEDDFYFYLNMVDNKSVRTEADEVSYGLHVILRFELEYDYFHGMVKVEDFPKEWNKRFEKMLGFKVKNDREGVLQDMHWSDGTIGYFPTYLLGSIYAAQLSEKVKEDEKIMKDIENFKLDSLGEWLKNHVHKYGRLLTSDEIINKACGRGLDSSVYMKYLEEKYGDIYGL